MRKHVSKRLQSHKFGQDERWIPPVWQAVVLPGSHRRDAEGNCAATEFKPHAIKQKHISRIIDCNMEDRWMNKLAHAATGVSGWAARVLAAAAVLAAIGIFGDATIAGSGTPSLFATHQVAVNA